MSENFYKLIKTPKIHNPNYKEHWIQVPFRMLICGQSGSGKTNWLLSMIKKMNNTFVHIYVCCRSKEEPLYQYIENKINVGNKTTNGHSLKGDAQEAITFYEVQDSNDIPDLDTLERQSLIVFDDLVSAGKDVQTKIAEYYIRARKKEVSCVYITQSYHAVAPIIRQQCNYIVLKKLSSNRNLSMILKDFPLDMTIDELKRLYASTTKGIEQFLIVDINKNEVRKNWVKPKDTSTLGF